MLTLENLSPLKLKLGSHVTVQSLAISNHSYVAAWEVPALTLSGALPLSVQFCDDPTFSRPGTGDVCMGHKIEPRRIALIVEDDFEVRGLAAALLEETELQVVETSSAEEALDHLRAHGEDVALLFASAHLPCLMNGVDLARTVSSQWPWVRTVLTSDEDYGDGADDIPEDVRLMPKPWRALEVLMEADRATRAGRQH